MTSARLLVGLACLVLAAGCVDQFLGEIHDEGTRTDAESIRWVDDEVGNQIQVNQVRSGIRWDQFRIQSDHGAQVRFNDEVAQPVSKEGNTIASTTEVSAGDVLRFCQEKDGPLSVTILVDSTHAAVHEFSFRSVDRANCP